MDEENLDNYGQNITIEQTPIERNSPPLSSESFNSHNESAKNDCSSIICDDTAQYHVANKSSTFADRGSDVVPRESISAEPVATIEQPVQNHASHQPSQNPCSVGNAHEDAAANKESSKRSSNNLRCCDIPDQNETFDKLFHTAGQLEEFMPQKLSARNFPAACIPWKTHGTIPEIARHVLHLDYKHLFKDDADDNLDDQISSPIAGETWDEFLGSAENEIVHPLDKLVVMFFCANNFLRQDLIAKMAQCQIAIPWLIPPCLKSGETKPMCLTWAMESVAVNWRSPSKLQSASSREMLLLNAPLFVVSFVRIGSNHISKSALASKTLSYSMEDHHSYFIGQDHLQGAAEKSISQGLVDLFWYMPTGEQGSKFSEPFIVANLHGCAMQHSKQFNLLSKISSVMFVLLSDEGGRHTECIEQLVMGTPSFSDKAQHVVLLNDRGSKQLAEALEQKIKSENRKVVSWNVQGQNLNKIAVGVHKMLSHFISSHEQEMQQWSTSRSHRMSLRQACSSAKDMDFRTDTDFCITGEESKKNFARSVEKQKEKQKILVLQSSLPHMADAEKECNRYTNKKDEKLEVYVSRKQQEIFDAKKQQANDLYEVMLLEDSPLKLFLLGLRANKKKSDLQYFMRSIKLILDERNRDRLTPLRSSYADLREQFVICRAKNPPDEKEFSIIQAEIKKVLEEIQSSHFGLEHMLREVALAEMTRLSNPNADAYDVLQGLKLPSIQAQLLLCGFPVEVMDGDSGTVHIKWLELIFDRLEQFLPRSNQNSNRIAVVSILGVQSSGKSTLLNAMFGINFAVSAGRCTRGIYAQLVPLDDSLRNTLNCDFILILDTEGIRAPERRSSTQSENIKDNELATFAVGLADLTIINIMGETDAELHDTLQIAVHAMLRMKKVMLSPMCILVHQNVNDRGAFESTIAAREKLQEDLDKATKDAAMLEERDQGEKEIKRFTDVIEFDYNDPNQVWYLPSLFEGNHTSLRYSERVQQLKAGLMKQLSSRNSHQHFSHVSAILGKIKNLWNAILKENFVFNFKNACEIKAYRFLQEKQVIWNWDIWNPTKGWEATAKNRIENCSGSLSNLEDALLNELQMLMDSKLTTILSGDFLAVFEESEFVRQLAQWKSRTENELRYLKEETQEKAWKGCQDQIQLKRVQNEMVGSKAHYETKLKKIAQQKLKSLQNSPVVLSDEKLNQEFEAFWVKCQQNLKNQLHLKSIESYDVVHILELAISQICRGDEKALRCFREILKHQPQNDLLNIEFLSWEKDYIRTGMITDFFSKLSKDSKLSKETITKLFGFAEHLHEEIMGILNTHEKNTAKVETKIAIDLFHSVIAKMDEFSKKHNVSFKSQFKGLVLYSTFRRAEKSFFKLQKKYIRLNDPMEYLNAKCKNSYFQIFKAKCQGYQGATLITENFLQCFEKTCYEDLAGRLPLILSDFLMRNSEFPHDKGTLIAKVLLELGEEVSSADNASLDRFVEFLQRPYDAIEGFLLKMAYETCVEKKATIEELMAMEAGKLHGIAEEAVQEESMTEEDPIRWMQMVVDTINSKSDSLHLSVLLDHISELLPTSEGSMEIQDMKSILLEGLTGMDGKLLNTLNLSDQTDLKKYGEMAGKKILESRFVIGCKERCPLCGAMCDFTKEGHEDSKAHYSGQHWPNGLIRYRWLSSQKMGCDICTTAVAMDWNFSNADTNDEFHPYKKYREKYPDWDIIPDTTLEASVYWKWFVAKFGTRLAEIYDVKPPDIPEPWMGLTWRDAAYSLDTQYNVKLKRKRKKPALSSFETIFENKIIGQSTAVSQVGAAIRRKESGWERDEPRRPLVLLFLGSSGTGKTEMAKQIAKYWNKQESGKGFIRVDMTEYQHEHEFAKFLGAPPGYIGHGQGNNLADKLGSCPKAVVLLDEVEKAHPKIFEIMLPMFDEGRLTDGKNKTVHFQDAIFIMTSNAATDTIIEHVGKWREDPNAPEQIEFDNKFKTEHIDPVLKRTFKRDEFLGRIKELVYFTPFSHANLKTLAEKGLTTNYVALNASDLDNSLRS